MNTSDGQGLTEARKKLSDFVFGDTINDMMLLAIHHLEKVRDSENVLGQVVHLKMASMAIEAALDVRRRQLAINKEEANVDV